MRKKALSYNSITSHLRKHPATCHSRESGNQVARSLHCVPLTWVKPSDSYRISWVSSFLNNFRIVPWHSPRRTQQKIAYSTLLFLSILVLFITSCTSTPDLWYKTGATQNDFNLDSRECEIIAEPFALQQSETGKRIDPVNFSQHYLQCINSKGWSRNKPVRSETDDQPPAPQPQLNIEQNRTTLSGFGLHITLPDNFTLVSSQHADIGPTTIQQFFWQDESNTFINVIFQKNNKTRFDISPYPISDPYQLYTSGTGEKAKDLLQWTTFFGKIQDEWVMGVGSFYKESKNQRLIIVITKNLDPPTTKPPANLTLSSNQHGQIEAFSNHWTNWLESQFPEKSKWTDWWKKLSPDSL